MGAASNWVLIFAAVGVVVTSAFPTSEEYEARENQDIYADDTASLIEEGVKRAYQFIRSCGDNGISFCLKMRALTYLDRALRRPGDLELLDGVALVRTQEGLDLSREMNGRALSEAELDASLPKNAEERETQVETLLVDKFAKFLQSHTLQLKVPDSAISEVRKTIDEGKCFS